jgi:hypothetical protein
LGAGRERLDGVDDSRLILADRALLGFETGGDREALGFRPHRARFADLFEPV